MIIRSLILFLFLLAPASVAEVPCEDTTSLISSTRTTRTKLCSVIHSKLISANNDNEEAQFNKVFNRNCGPGTATSQWEYFPGNCTCTCAMDFTGPTDNPTPAPTPVPTPTPTPAPTPASCFDSVDKIHSTKGSRTKLCSVIESKLVNAIVSDDEATFNRVKTRNCGPGPANWQWGYFPGNCTCTCAMEFCLDDITFRTALDLWFYDQPLAISTYGNIANW
jgi:hypothetical protein